jgi:energy-coupling factor transport system ATP-binding protein
MEDVAEYADRIIVMDEGHVRFDGTPRDVFSHYIELEEMGLAAPEVTYFMHDLRDAGWDVDPLETDIDKAAAQIAAAFKRGGAR